jgi:hypothetical protein
MPIELKLVKCKQCGEDNVVRGEKFKSRCSHVGCRSKRWLEVDIRQTKTYKKLTPYMATAIAEGFCEGENASNLEKVCAWQYLHDTKLAYQLQGWFGRTTQNLIEKGVIKN